MKTLQLLLLFCVTLLPLLIQAQGPEITHNHISKESGSSASSSSSTTADDPSPAPAPAPPGPAPPVPPVPVPVPGPVFPGFGKGIGFHKNINFEAGAGLNPFAGLFPGLFPGAGAPLPPGAVPPAPPGAAVPPPPGTLDVPPVDPGLGGFPVAGPGYLGLPPFLGPSYVPYTWIGSALGAKGDLLFPVVIFLFVVVGVWTVVQFLLGLIVPLIAAKFEVGESIVKAKANAINMKGHRQFRSIEEMHQDRVNSVTAAVMDALEKTNDLHQHSMMDVKEDQNSTTAKTNTTSQHKHPLFSAFA